APSRNRLRRGAAGNQPRAGSSLPDGRLLREARAACRLDSRRARGAAQIQADNGMRLTDECQVVTSRGGRVGGPGPGMFGHTGGDVGLDGTPLRYTGSARVIVGPDAELAGDARALRVEHNGVTYGVMSILPRYRTHGRLHH